MKYNNFQEAYYGLIKDVINNGNTVTVRGLDMLELIPKYFEIENPRDRLLNIKCRNKINRYIFGELLWYLSGKDDVEFINKYSKKWKQLSDDGIHNNSAYGKYIFRQMPTKGYGVNYDNNTNFISQWDYVKETLIKDKYSRQAVIHIKPIQMYETKDVTCTFLLHFFVRNNKLDMIVYMRSNDLLYGTTYDVFMFTFLQELMAVELDLELGTYKHMTSNLHIYKENMKLINAILKENAEKTKTVTFASIPKNFREKDLPLLLSLEKMFWENKNILNTKEYSNLSTIGKQLINLLVGNNNEKSK